MGFNNLLTTVQDSLLYKDFIKTHEKAELVAGFFVLDFEGLENKQALDYMIEEKIFTFSVNPSDEITLTEDKLIEKPGLPKLSKIPKNVRIDLEEIPSRAEKIAQENKTLQKFQKIIAVLQNHEGNFVWNLTCMLDGMAILNIIISTDTGEVLKFERKSMMDFIKKK